MELIIIIDIYSKDILYFTSTCIYFRKVAVSLNYDECERIVDIAYKNSFGNLNDISKVGYGLIINKVLKQIINIKIIKVKNFILGSDMNTKIILAKY